MNSERSLALMRSSRALLRRARAGDSQALSKLFGGVLPVLRRWAHGRVPRWARNAVDTDDLVQETVLRTMRRLQSFEPEGDDALLHYLRRSLLNRVRNQLRYSARHPRADLADDHPDPGMSPLEFVIAEENRSRYVRALGRLRAIDRTAIVGRLELGYSYEQLALVLDKPTPGAARVSARRALLRLAQEMRRI